MTFSKTLLFGLLMLAGSWTFAQRNVGGTVTDAKSKEPLIGANVLVKGTSIGTITEVDGSWTLSVPAGSDVLIFSYTGYGEKEVRLGADNVINVAMEEGTLLDEVIVVGYGIQKKSVVTGVISSLKTKDLEKVPSARVEQSLQGRVSGVTIAQNSGQPGSPSTIRIRGITTFG
ncbi:MAG TPA: carboxypeptidase-like regulatory domain-containing protein, partial [Saprospiraceae bacterium]|nr:carboxypeptidase-like regulatory domain-containing protein [Saprospiraceae bacterium]